MPAPNRNRIITITNHPCFLPLPNIHISSAKTRADYPSRLGLCINESNIENYEEIIN